MHCRIPPTHTFLPHLRACFISHIQRIYHRLRWSLSATSYWTFFTLHFGFFLSFFLFSFGLNGAVSVSRRSHFNTRWLHSDLAATSSSAASNWFHALFVLSFCYFGYGGSLVKNKAFWLFSTHNDDGRKREFLKDSEIWLVCFNKPTTFLSTFLLLLYFYSDLFFFSLSRKKKLLKITF